MAFPILIETHFLFSEIKYVGTLLTYIVRNLTIFSKQRERWINKLNRLCHFHGKRIKYISAVAVVHMYVNVCIDGRLHFSSRLDRYVGLEC